MEKSKLQSLTKKERKDYLKNLKGAQGNQSNLKSLAIKASIVLGFLILIAGGLYLYNLPQPERPEIGEVFADQGREHIPEGLKEHEPYNSNPPTSGQHWPVWAPCRIHEEEIDDEYAVHSLEHGAVWITYKDKNDRQTKEALEDIAKRSQVKVLISPRSANDSKIAVASWGRLLKLDEINEELIEDFIKFYRNSAPESFATC